MDMQQSIIAFLILIILMDNAINARLHWRNQQLTRRLEIVTRSDDVMRHLAWANDLEGVHIVPFDCDADERAFQRHVHLTTGDG